MKAALVGRGRDPLPWRASARAGLLAMLLAVSAGPAIAIDDLMTQGESARRAGNVAEALRLFDAAWKRATAVHGDMHPDTLAAMFSAARSLVDLGRPTEALPIFETLHRVRSEVLGERHPDTLSALNGRSVVLGDLGRVQEQVALSESLLRLRTEVLGERHPSTLTALHNLAKNYRVLGRLGDSLAMNQKVAQLRAEVLGPTHPHALSSLNNLAIVYSVLGRWQEHQDLIEKVLATSLETLGERDFFTLGVMSNLALNYGVLGRVAEQVALDEKVLRLRTETLGERHPATLDSMNNLALSLGAAGRAAEQLTLLEEVLRRVREIQGERHPNTVESMVNLVAAYAAVGRDDDALAMAGQAMQLGAETLGDRHPDTLAAIEAYAERLARSGRLREAAALSGRYVAGAEWQRGQTGLTAALRQSLFQGYADSYRRFSLLHARLGDLVEGLNLAERGKARTLLESMAAQQASRSGVIAAADADALEDLGRQIGALDQLVAQSAEGDARRLLERQRNELSRQRESLMARLKAEHPKFAALSDVRIVGAADLPGLVPPQALAISYVQSARGELAAYLVDAHGEIQHVALGAVPHLADAIEIWRRFNANPTRRVLLGGDDGWRAWRLVEGGYRLLEASVAAPLGAVPVPDLREVGQYLAGLLLQPLQAALKDKTRLVIAPDGALSLLPFETLPWGPGGTLVLDTEIHYTQSLSVYALSRQLQSRRQELQDRRGLFAMGNALYEDPRTLEAGQAALVEGTRSRLRSMSMRDASQLRELDGLWPNLPGTEAEVRAVARLFPGSASVYLGEQATEQQLQALNARGELKNYRYLLLSAHGYLSAEQPALSSIVLGLKARTPEADGYVTAAEWPGYDLRSELAVLSACDSGVGKVVSGEGVMGLPFAMFVAGNVNTILSLWPVDDKATAEFVTRLFEHLRAGQGAAQALAATKREFARHRRYGHPAYWAPFVLVGAG